MRNYKKWSKEEVEALRKAVAKHGTQRWALVLRDSELSALKGRSRHQMRQKWKRLQAHAPSVVTKQFWSPAEELALIKGVNKHGEGRWSWIRYDPAFATALAERTPAQLKDKWRSFQPDTRRLRTALRVADDLSDLPGRWNSSCSKGSQVKSGDGQGLVLVMDLCAKVTETDDFRKRLTWMLSFIHDIRQEWQYCRFVVFVNDIVPNACVRTLIQAAEHKEISIQRHHVRRAGVRVVGDDSVAVTRALRLTQLFRHSDSTVILCDTLFDGTSFVSAVATIMGTLRRDNKELARCTWTSTSGQCVDLPTPHSGEEKEEREAASVDHEHTDLKLLVWNMGPRLTRLTTSLSPAELKDFILASADKFKWNSLGTSFDEIVLDKYLEGTLVFSPAQCSNIALPSIRKQVPAISSRARRIKLSIESQSDPLSSIDGLLLSEKRVELSGRTRNNTAADCKDPQPSSAPSAEERSAQPFVHSPAWQSCQRQQQRQKRQEENVLKLLMKGDYCWVCYEKSILLVACDCCGAKFHHGCIRPKLMSITSQWVCAYCLEKDPHISIGQRAAAEAAVQLMEAQRAMCS